MRGNPPRPSSVRLSAERPRSGSLARVEPINERLVADSMIPTDNVSSPFSIARRFSSSQLGPDRVPAPSDQRMRRARSAAQRPGAERRAHPITELARARPLRRAVSCSLPASAVPRLVKVVKGRPSRSSLPCKPSGLPLQFGFAFVDLAPFQNDDQENDRPEDHCEGREDRAAPVVWVMERACLKCSKPGEHQTYAREDQEGQQEPTAFPCISQPWRPPPDAANRNYPAQDNRIKAASLAAYPVGRYQEGSVSGLVSPP